MNTFVQAPQSPRVWAFFFRACFAAGGLWRPGFVLGDLPPIAPITHKFLRDDLWSFASGAPKLALRGAFTEPLKRSDLAVAEPVGWRGGLANAIPHGLLMVSPGR
jgi:hypothetical protein